MESRIVASANEDDLSITALEDLERITILRVFEKTGGNKALAGQMLGISRATLYRKLKHYDIPMRRSQKEWPEFHEISSYYDLETLHLCCLTLASPEALA